MGPVPLVVWPGTGVSLPRGRGDGKHIPEAIPGPQPAAERDGYLDHRDGVVKAPPLAPGEPPVRRGAAPARPGLSWSSDRKAERPVGDSQRPFRDWATSWWPSSRYGGGAEGGPTVPLLALLPLSLRVRRGAPSRGRVPSSGLTASAVRGSGGRPPRSRSGDLRRCSHEVPG